MGLKPTLLFTCVILTFFDSSYGCPCRVPLLKPDSFFHQIAFNFQGFCREGVKKNNHGSSYSHAIKASHHFKCMVMLGVYLLHISKHERHYSIWDIGIQSRQKQRDINNRKVSTLLYQYSISLSKHTTLSRNTRKNIGHNLHE